ncbi:esterase-like activity of phytase family protein [Curtobacterium sp. MCBD17_035]|uniref:esterase-like activity of phytase family protein n=1 Tax=Curtobacterium sp. MCBD17_035 TaxID=2175673 RepID=UPI000DA95009|nr:esterase-like activity of phytase family protein [Curtobacterium sp. MCBD17_035]WIB68932.1 esterase-like activity of phytase family protein [Curtobacterium sp. MCBD17_035]
MRRSIATSVVAAVGIAGGLLTAMPATAAPSADLVVNEVYGGGRNAGSTFTNDFVELANRGSSTIDLSGHSVQYHAGSATGTWQVTPLSGTLAPGGRYLVAEAKGAGGTTALPTPDVTGTIAMSATDGTVAVVASRTALTCADSATCVSASVDLVGFGSAAIAEGSPAVGASNTASVQRQGASDDDHNATDFAAAAPTPGAANTASTTTPPTGPAPEPGTVRIHDIQGTSFVSPLNGEQVTNVPGIVTGIRTSGSSKGYWIQDPDADSDPATSEGVFVYSSSRAAVAAGDSVLVSGTVRDYYPLASGDTTATTSNLSVTELTNATATVVSTGDALPAPIVLGPTSVPDTSAPDLAGGNIESTPITPTRTALDFFESLEGMRVEVDDARVVGPSDEYGEQYVTTKPSQLPTTRGGTLLTAENATPSGRLEVVAANGSNPRVDVGDVFRGATVGEVDYSQYGGYDLTATTLGSVARGGITPTVATTPKPDQLSVATYNVENLAPSDPATKFAALAKGVVANLRSPDILTVEEVQDDDGATDDGVVAADQTIAKLTAAITTAGGPSYASREIDPVNDADGGQPGGNIRVVFLFNPKRVRFDDRGPASVNRSTTATVVTSSHGVPDVTLSPGRIAPTDAAWQSSRKPLVGEFTFRGRRVFVIGNHFDAKLGDQNQDGRFQYPARSSAVQRQQQAQLVHDFTAQILKVDARAAVVVAGDLNDHQFSPALATLTGKPLHGQAATKPVLTDLITTLPANQQYTYVYDGISEVLDHILVTAGVGTPDYQVVHLNAEFADQTSDHDPQVVRVFGHHGGPSQAVPPAAVALGYSDALDKLVHNGAEVGGLSSLAYDGRSRSWISAVDNHADDPSRIWFFRNLDDPTVTRDPLVLRNEQGVPYTGLTADDEGLAVLPNGDYLVSSETEPSIRVFGRDGVQKAQLPVPGRFAVTGTALSGAGLEGASVPGEATANATLEGLSISPSGHTIVASMEGALSGDVSAAGDATAHRLLVYTRGRSGAWALTKQVGYRTDTGNRIPEVALVSDDRMLVEEAAFSATAGNSADLYSVSGLSRASDVSGVRNLSAAPASRILRKTLVADLVKGPTLGATALETQTNPLLDNYEGMAITGRAAGGRVGVALISDDNFGALQRTRILDLAVRLPR